MATDLSNSSITQVQDIISRLQSPIADLVTLLSLLCSPLNSLGLLPPQFRRFDNSLALANTPIVARHIPIIQRAILVHIAPTWKSTLDEEKKSLVLTQFFCPDSFSFASPAAGEVALSAYSTILSLPLSEFSVSLLARLSVEYPLDRLYKVVFFNQTADPFEKRSIAWEDCLRNIASVPAKVANAIAEGLEIPPELEQGRYFNNLCLRCEILIFSLSTAPTEGMLVNLLIPQAKL